MTTPIAPDPEWFTWATGQPPTTLDVWDGTPSLFLAPTIHGAILWWQFDQGEDGSQYVLLTHLDDNEAQTVFETRSGDPLSGVRAHQQDNRAIIARRHPPSGYEVAFMFYMPRKYNEAQFADWLDEILEVISSQRLPDPNVKWPHIDISWSRVPHKPNASPLDALAATVVHA